jgi:glycosyltransferase involved in cell wall biosynthesis
MAVNTNQDGNTLRVLLISPVPPPYGGIAHWTLLLKEWLSGENGIALQQVDTAPHWRAIHNLNIFQRLICGGIQGIRDAWRTVIALIRFHPNVMHLTTSGSLAGFRDIVLLSMGRFTRISTIYHIRIGRLPEIIEQNNWEWQLIRMATKLALYVVVLDSSSGKALNHLLPKGKLLLLPNAIDLKKHKVAVAEQKQCGLRTAFYLGWMIPTKGMQELMEAWRDCSTKGWVLQIAGPGDEAYRKELSETVGTKATVDFLGELAQDKAWKKMVQCDIFVLPTYTEGFPNVILEAMAAGKAILTTSVGAIPEMLDIGSDEPCGLVVEPRDANALSSGLHRLMTDHQLRDVLGKRARAKVECCYTTDVVFNELVSLWEAVSGRKAKTAKNGQVLVEH